MDKLNLYIRKENNLLAKNAKLDEYRLPIIVLTGGLGSGKSTLLQHLYSQRFNLRFRVGIDDFAVMCKEDYQIKDKDLYLFESTADESLKLYDEIENFIYDTLCSKRFEYLIIETSGTLNPMYLIQMIQRSYGKCTRAILDSIITVVDMAKWATFMERNSDGRMEQHCTMLGQIRYADCIVWNKIDTVAHKEKVKQYFMDYWSRTENVKVHAKRMIECSHGQVALPYFLDVERCCGQNDTFVSHESEGRLQWQQKSVPVGKKQRDVNVSESDRDGLLTVIVEHEKPITLGAFTSWLKYCKQHYNVIRCKGLVYLVEESQNRFSIQWSGTCRYEIQNHGIWTMKGKNQWSVVMQNDMNAKEDLRAKLLELVNETALTKRHVLEHHGMRKLIEQERLRISYLCDGTIAQCNLVLADRKGKDESFVRHHLHINLDEINNTFLETFNQLHSELVLVPSKTKHGKVCFMVPLLFTVEYESSWDLLCAQLQHTFENCVLKSFATCTCTF